MKSAALAGVGVVQLPVLMLQEQLRTGALVSVLPNWSLPRVYAAVRFGRWTLVFTGFTACPDVCPTTLLELAEVQRQLAEESANVRLLFLSVDPEVDTPEVLRAHLRFFSVDIQGATGTLAEVHALSTQLGMRFSHVPRAAGSRVDHSGALALLDPEVRVRAYFRPPFDVQRLTADLAALPDARS